MAILKDAFSVLLYAWQVFDMHAAAFCRQLGWPIPGLERAAMEEIGPAMRMVPLDANAAAKAMASSAHYPFLGLPLVRLGFRPV